ncbi:cobaltochelatase subunit CobN [Botrimarina colliarenosi]|uniref:cobaltochelatase subunit CobN n=1 Tax=Botrimarina colliarenosi TaxID=2528001 RepID=UPI001E3D174B|nr:cobaltochelatase subunit CobN [Botrimarina colliarenosi]
MVSRFQALVVACAVCCADSAAAQVAPAPRLAFVGLHGGVFEQLEVLQSETGMELDYLRDDDIAAGKADLAPYRIVFFQHTREEDREQYRRMIEAGRAANPQLRIFSISGLVEGDLPELARSGVIEQDERLSAYYGSSTENLRRMLRYIWSELLGHGGAVPPPEEVGAVQGLYHPNNDGMFADAASFLQWARGADRPIDSPHRVLIAVHTTHLVFQQPKVVDALIRAFESRGVLAVGAIDGGPAYEAALREFGPQCVIHTCHSRESVELRTELGIPHLHSIFFRKQSIDDWRTGVEGLASNEMAFQVIGQELLGAIEPQIGAGTEQGGGSSEAFSPIAERIDHLTDRAVAWMRLATLPNAEKKIAFVYYDREMGKAELMRGSATGMFMNGPRSLVNVLQRMRDRGYALSDVPADEDELIGWMQERGRQIGVWAPGVLDQLARSGDAVLVPLDQYRAWFEARVPEPLRQQVIARWGEPPGDFLVWKNDAGEPFLVIPRIDLGGVTLLPQPLRGEAQDTSLVHDKLVPPPHNYLATYFWLEASFGANALVHFGTHGTEFMLPGKAVGLSDEDWPDIVLGTMPNINPWILNNLGESSPTRRRAYAVLIDHLVPPSVNAELWDELENLHNDIDHWIVLDDGALKEKFRRTISEQVRNENLDKDVGLDLPGGRMLTPAEIEQVLSYLHDVHNETTPVSLHVFGEPPRDDLLIPYLTTCLGKAYLTALDVVIDVPAGEALTPGDSLKYLRRAGEEIVSLVVRKGMSPAEALAATTGADPAAAVPAPLAKSLSLAGRLAEGFARTGEEVDNLLAALDGKFIPPGPGGGPDRNAAALPTGRNLYVMNPEEVPTKPSWELGGELVDQLLAQKLQETGRYPEKIGFTLNSFATFQDYGVMESQILRLVGVRPVWDEQNLVVDVELIPAEELGRPRIDVFIAGQSYYRDMLPTRMRLLDKAIRLVAQTEELDNWVWRNSQQTRQDLEEAGVDAARAEKLSQARIFGHPLGQYGSAGYYYLVEKSGEWDTREDLMEVYLSQSRYVYTDGLWGDNAPEAYDRSIQGTEIVLRSWSDRTRSPLSNKYDWYHGGSLCMAVKHLTGVEPEYFLSDVRDPDSAGMVSAEEALRREYRVRLLNRKWIEGMMREGYAGADQIGVHVSNTMGWKIMRPDSVSDDIWEEIVEIYVRDSKSLAIREWFEAENPYAFQDLTEVLLESIRKGYWRPSDEVVREIAVAYAESVARHGEGGGLRGGGNTKLEEFVRNALSAPSDAATGELVAAYEARLEESAGFGAAATSASTSTSSANDSPPDAAPEETTATQTTGRVTGQQLVEAAAETTPAVETPFRYLWLLGLVIAATLIGAGYLTQDRKTG